jgi:hypothetical protein
MEAYPSISARRTRAFVKVLIAVPVLNIALFPELIDVVVVTHPVRITGHAKADV